MSVVGWIFLLLVVYQLKHWLCDYLLQGDYMLGKFKPGWGFFGPLLAHAGVHAGFTFFIAMNFFEFTKFGWPLCSHGFCTELEVAGWAGLIALFDGTVHFFMDRIKAGPRYMGRWKALSGPEFVEALKAREKVKELEDTLYPNFWGAPDGRNLLDLAREKADGLRKNKLFWWALGFDQMVHHLTHYACIYFILKIAGVL